jgi:hypothetical protein
MIFNVWRNKKNPLDARTGWRRIIKERKIPTSHSSSPGSVYMYMYIIYTLHYVYMNAGTVWRARLTGGGWDAFITLLRLIHFCFYMVHRCTRWVLFFSPSSTLLLKPPLGDMEWVLFSTFLLDNKRLYYSLAQNRVWFPWWVSPSAMKRFSLIIV